MSKTKALATVPSAETLAELRNEFPVTAGFTRRIIPRLGMFSQDQTEGKGKAMKVTTEAGTFYTEKQTDEEDENGKKVWAKEEIGTETQGIIMYQRKQLRFYDASTEEFTSSPIYDTDDEIIPLFRDKKEIVRGTPAELKSRKEYQGVNASGKPTSKLEDNRILYVLMDGETYQLNLRGTSMYAFLRYSKEVLCPGVLTAFSSEPKENGSTQWNQMTFTKERDLSAEEVEDILGRIREIKQSIAEEKEYYASQTGAVSDGRTAAQKSLDEF